MSKIRRLFCFLTVAVLSASPVPAQEVVPQDTVSGTGSDSTPVLLAAGVSSGFPGFNRFSVQASVQYRFVGLAVKAAPTPAGLYFGGTIRGYLPFGGFVPMYAGLGGGVYGDSTELHLVLGGHIPVSEHFRVDLEAGAARASTLGVNSWLPWVSIGVSYSVAVSPGDLAASTQAATEFRAASGRDTPGVCGLPTEASLVSAFERTLGSFIRSAEATYGGSYTDLQYDYSIINVTMGEDSGSVTIRYSGSVRPIVGGGRESAAGTASVSFNWDGCRWRESSLDY